MAGQHLSAARTLPHLHDGPVPDQVGRHPRLDVGHAGEQAGALSFDRQNFHTPIAVPLRACPASGAYPPRSTTPSEGGIVNRLPGADNQ